MLVLLIVNGTRLLERGVERKRRINSDCFCHDGAYYAARQSFNRIPVTILDQTPVFSGKANHES